MCAVVRRLMIFCLDRTSFIQQYVETINHLVHLLLYIQSINIYFIYSGGRLILQQIGEIIKKEKRRGKLKGKKGRN